MNRINKNESLDLALFELFYSCIFPRLCPMSSAFNGKTHLLKIEWHFSSIKPKSFEMVLLERRKRKWKQLNKEDVVPSIRFVDSSMHAVSLADKSIWRFDFFLFRIAQEKAHIASEFARTFGFHVFPKSNVTHSTRGRARNQQIDLMSNTRRILISPAHLRWAMSAHWKFKE